MTSSNALMQAMPMATPEDADRLTHPFVVAAVVSCYFLHLLRNVSEIFAFVPVIASLGAVMFFLVKKNSFDYLGSLVLLLFLLTYFFPVAYSLLWYPSESYLIPFARYFYLLPFAIFCLFAIRTINHAVFVLKIFSIFMVLSVVSMVYQILFGPITWFAEASEREGLVRFSSLAGSLTAFGILGGMALPIIYFLFKNGFVRFIFLFMVIVGMLITLQKAAVANLILFFVFLMCYASLSAKLKLLVTILAVGPLLLFAAYVFEVNYVVATVDNVLRFRDGSGSSDVALFQSMIDRAWSLPSQLFAMHGPLGLFLGVGMVGGSGTLGFSEYPMAHNAVFDLIFIGGFLNLLAFVVLSTFVLHRVFGLRRAFVTGSAGFKALTVMAILYMMLLINMLFAGPLHMHPYGGVIFYVITVLTCIRYTSLKRYARAGHDGTHTRVS